MLALYGVAYNMSFEFSDFSVLTDYLVQYMFGNTLVLSIFLFVAFLLYMTLNRVPLPIALSVVLPLSSSLIISGWIGQEYRYILALVVVVMGIVISNVLVRFYTRR